MKKDYKKNVVADITTLAEVFLDTLKEISKSGNVLNTSNYAMLLAKKPFIKEILRLAKKGQDDVVFESKNTELKNQQAEQEEERKQHTFHHIMELESQIDQERDFNKRATIALISLCANQNNDTINQILEEYKQTVVDEKKIDKREDILYRLKNQLLKSDFSNPQQTETFEISEEKKEQSPKKSMLRKFFSESTEINFSTLKKNVIKAIDEFEIVMGKDFSDDIEILKERVNKSDNLDYLFSLRKQIFNLLQNYSEAIQKEREQITEFVKQVGKKLTEVEEDIITSFSGSSDVIASDMKFNENIGNQIKNIKKSFETEEQDFDELRSFIVSELLRISATLEEKRREYVARIERAKENEENLKLKFEKMISSVMEQNKMLIEQNQKDPLTGIFNRVTFDERISIEFQRYLRYNETFSVIMFDLDNFKNVNDSYGHLAGDRVLKGVSRAVLNILRNTDVFARYGGEEFVILLPETMLDMAYIVAEKIREVVQQTEFIYDGQRVPVTISAGVTEVWKKDNDIRSIYERADKNLYKTKSGGKNSVTGDK